MGLGLSLSSGIGIFIADGPGGNRALSSDIVEGAIEPRLALGGIGALGPAPASGLGGAPAAGV